MKLEKIKLSGFKSFVDPTVIPIHGNLTAIVGPNGCGKSNIIDAVRWVMGESSAKHLRGGNMADVIFNGSSGRKPVSTASVELIFDNSEGKLGGEYAQYDSIAIKRQVSRDGQSLFLLNGSRCRRKDITDLFLGTGLGARSYAIIEQGTISRMVEAKPEDLRMHIEEAAGISKYKERRHETENRMKHTRENLERLDDLREEVEKQLKHLQKQAEKAEKYTDLKQQERQYRLELLAMRWQAYDKTRQHLEAKLQQTANEHNRLFMEVRDTHTNLDTKRIEQKQQQQQFNQAQGDYYAIVAEVTGLQQAIKHHENSHEETIQDLQRTQQQVEQLHQQLETDLMNLEELKEQMFSAEEHLSIAEEQQEESLHRQQTIVEQKNAWQAQWENYRTLSSENKEQVEVHKVKVLQLENQYRHLQSRQTKLEAERDDLASSQLNEDMETLDTDIEIISFQRDDYQAQLEQLQHQIRDQRQHVKQLHEYLHSRRSESHSTKGKITSLELLQQHAMGKDNKNLNAWLESMQIDKNSRLAEFLHVDIGWETAVETALGRYLEAICVNTTESMIPHLNQLNQESLTLLTTNETSNEPFQAESSNLSPLLAKIKAPWDIETLLSGIYCADTPAQAYLLSTQLNTHESVITPDGTWLGSNWLRVTHTKDSKVGVLQREKELRTLKERQETLNHEINEFEEQLSDTESALKEAELLRESIQQQDNKLGSELSLKSAEFSAYSTRWDNQQRRLEHIANDLEEILHEINETTEIIAESTLLQEEAEQVLNEQDSIKHTLEADSQQLHSQQAAIDRAVNDARQNTYAGKAKIDALRHSTEALSKQIERLQGQHQQALAWLTSLEQKRQQTLAPLDDEKAQLAEQLFEKDRLETHLKVQRQLQEQFETEITQLSEQQTQAQRALEQQKEGLDTLRFELQECKVRQQTLNEQLKEIDAQAEHVLKTLPLDAEEAPWKNKVDDLTHQIERLGTINLTAIEEYKSQAERMKFLNEQHQDLCEALELLDQAISKIDKESRLRFKETFDKINTGLQEKFPKLFGGGQAYLELTEQDLLESGVNIIARPPGKRNSSIHLLSGGEKALTAVALVFSIFELNPAPFCLLDEVDAPLDDANVGRFSKMVEEMSASVQFLYISHNKVTMEIAKQLTGVTMKEPGVSRMVAVDIEEAVSLAEI